MSIGKQKQKEPEKNKSVNFVWDISSKDDAKNSNKEEIEVLKMMQGIVTKKRYKF